MRRLLFVVLLAAACSSGGSGTGGPGPGSGLQGEALLQQMSGCAVARMGELLAVIDSLRVALSDPASVPGVTPTSPTSFDFSFDLDLDADGQPDATLAGSISFSEFPPMVGTTADLSYDLSGGASGNGTLDLLFNGTEVQATGMGIAQGTDCDLAFEVDPADPLRFPVALAQLAGLAIPLPQGGLFVTVTLGTNSLTVRVGFEEGRIVSIHDAALNGEAAPTTDFEVPVDFATLDHFLAHSGCVARLIRSHAAALAKAGEILTALDPADYATLSPDPVDPSISQFEARVDTDGDGETDATLRGKLVDINRVDLFRSPPAPGETPPAAFVSDDGYVFAQSLGATILYIGDDCIIVNTGGGGMQVQAPAAGGEGPTLKCTAIFAIQPAEPDLVLETEGLHDRPGEVRVADAIGVMERIGLTLYEDDVVVATMTAGIEYLPIPGSSTASAVPEPTLPGYFVTFFPETASVGGNALTPGKFSVPVPGT